MQQFASNIPISGEYARSVQRLAPSHWDSYSLYISFKDAVAGPEELGAYALTYALFFDSEFLFRMPGIF
jgi:hypothetical protein